jgi:hypothetical protein
MTVKVHISDCRQFTIASFDERGVVLLITKQKQIMSAKPLEKFTPKLHALSPTDCFTVSRNLEITPLELGAFIKWAVA